MKINKKVLGLVLVGMLSVGVVGCGSNEPNLQGREVPSKMEEMPIEEKEPTYNFDEYNILSFSNIEVDNTPDYDGDTYIDFKCKVTNNSDKMLSDVEVDFGYYDEEGVLLSSTHPNADASVPNGSSFYVDSSYDTKEYNVKEIKIVGYSYYIGEVYYTVDLMSQIVEVWE